MKSQVGPSSKDLFSEEVIKNFLSKDEVVVVGFFEIETDLKGKFHQLANKLREKVNFGHTTTKSIIDKYNYKYVFRQHIFTNIFNLIFLISKLYFFIFQIIVLIYYSLFCLGTMLCFTDLNI